MTSMASKGASLRFTSRKQSGLQRSSEGESTGSIWTAQRPHEQQQDNQTAGPKSKIKSAHKGYCGVCVCVSESFCNSVSKEHLRNFPTRRGC